MAIIKCPECGHQISEKATVCPICGVEIAGNIVKCSYCGEVYFKDDGICPHCYRSLPHGVHDTEEEETSPEGSSSDDSDDFPEEGANNNAEEEKGQETVSGENVEEVFPVVEEEENEEAEYVEEKGEEVAVEGNTEEEHQSMKEEERENHPSSSQDEDDADEEETYIDTDEENLEKPVHEVTKNDEEGGIKHKYIPIVVSLAIAALIAAVCLYFYNDSKLSRETHAFELAMKSNDVNEMNNFLRNFTDATSNHKKAIRDKIEDINKQKDDLSLSLVTRDKGKILQFLKDYPDTPQKQTLLATVDSIDWEEATRANTKISYEKYLAAHATGLFSKEAKDKITVKIVAATAEDEARAKSLFREFFLSVNGNDASRLSATLSPQLTSFLGKSNPNNGEVVAWMKNQHQNGVSNVIWKLNHDYKITKREQNDIKESAVDFTAKQTIIHQDGRASSEHYKISASVTENNKISSMSMTKYVPKPGEQPSTSSSSSGNNKTSTNTASNVPQAKKPSTNGTTSPKPSNTNNTSKPSGSSNTSKPSGSSNTNKPSGSSSTSKPSSSGNTSKQSERTNKTTSSPKPSTSQSSSPKK